MIRIQKIYKNKKSIKTQVGVTRQLIAYKIIKKEKIKIRRTG